MSVGRWVLLASISVCACGGHAAEFPAPQPASGSSRSELVTLHGIARNVKGGPCLIDDREGKVWVSGLAEWPPDLSSRRVIATGQFVMKGAVQPGEGDLTIQTIGGPYRAFQLRTFRLE